MTDEFEMFFGTPEVQQRIDDQVSDLINDAVADGVAAQLTATETALRHAVADIRHEHRTRPTVVVAANQPLDVDFFFPATVVRSTLVEPGVAYILPSEAEIDDVMRQSGYSTLRGWDGDGPVIL